MRDASLIGWAVSLTDCNWLMSGVRRYSCCDKNRWSAKEKTAFGWRFIAARGGGSYEHPFLDFHADVIVCVPGNSDWLKS